MDKKVIFAVAGSGKTTYIIEKLTLEKRSLVITYTINNLNNLRVGIINKFGYFPDNIKLMSYFTFIYTICYRPLLSFKYNTNGITFERNPNQFARQTDYSYFFDVHGRIYSNRIAKFLEIQRVLSDVNIRIYKYFDNLFIDEVQDIAGHDFNFISSIARTNIEMTFVGDFYQHTFDTSRDGNVNVNLHDDYSNYKTYFENMGLSVDVDSLNKSFRCSPTICDFITKNIGIEIHSNRSDDTRIQTIDSQEKVDEIYHDGSIIKLFYREHYKYGCNSRNWGESKGENRYGDVCVVLNRETLRKFPNKLNELNLKTRNKLYVACSRARNDLYFIPFNFLEQYKS